MAWPLITKKVQEWQDEAAEEAAAAAGSDD